MGCSGLSCAAHDLRGSIPFWQVKVAVEACLVGVFAGARDECTVSELRSLMFQWTSRELDVALAALVDDGTLEVEGGTIRIA